MKSNKEIDHILISLDTEKYRRCRECNRFYDWKMSFSFKLMDDEVMRENVFQRVCTLCYWSPSEILISIEKGSISIGQLETIYGGLYRIYYSQHDGFFICVPL